MRGVNLTCISDDSAPDRLTFLREAEHGRPTPRLKWQIHHSLRRPACPCSSCYRYTATNKRELIETVGPPPFSSPSCRFRVRGPKERPYGVERNQTAASH